MSPDVSEVSGSKTDDSARSVSLVQMKTVYLLRHGEALHNLVDRGAGSYERRRDPSLADPPLRQGHLSGIGCQRSA